MDVIKSAIFDMDGTILDSMNLWLTAGNVVLGEFNVQGEENLGEKLFEMTFFEGGKYLKENYGLKVSVEEVCEKIRNVVAEGYRKNVMPKKGALEFLKVLKNKGVKIALCTNTPRSLFESALDRLKISSFFDIVVTTEEFGFSKGDGRIFLYTAEKLNSSVSDTWVFEDALYALKGAAKAGFKTVGVFDSVSLKFQDEIKNISDEYFFDFEKDARLFADRFISSQNCDKTY